MPLNDYAVKQDMFEYEGGDYLCFPCCVCKHRSNPMGCDPCRTCGHNACAEQIDNSACYTMEGAE